MPFNAFDPFSSAPDYYGLGGRMLPGGRLAVSPSMSGDPRSMSGIDIPLPGTGGPLPPEYQNSIPGAGLPTRTETGGYGAPDFSGLNIPPNENVAPNLTDSYYWDDVFAPGGAAPRAPSGFGIPSVPQPAYPNLRNAPPVLVNLLRSFAPGGGAGGPRAGDWAASASRAPALPPIGAFGIAGQGGSYFGGPGTTDLPGGGSFNQAGYGQNIGGMFAPPRHPLSGADVHQLAGESGWAKLFPKFDWKQYARDSEARYRAWAANPKAWSFANAALSSGGTSRGGGSGRLV